MKIAVVGASGLVGQKMLQIMAERNFPIDELIPVASERSIGKQIPYLDKQYTIVSMEDAIAAKPDIALFSAGGSVSLENAPKFAEAGTVVIDNSSAWRMDAGKKLIVPEVNGNTLRIDDRIIANPNCSTIQMVVALKPLHDAFKINRVVVSTYQSVTGSGKGAVDQLEGERSGTNVEMVYPYKIDMNALPHIDVFQENGYTKEEMKMINETMKIMGDDTIKVTATCVRIPTVGGHSESINVAFETEFSLEQVYSILEKAPGVTIVDNPSNNEYPMPLTAHDKDDVFVGRIRRDETQPKTLNMWVVSDNLRKGAATNAIQIAEYMIENSLVY
ncbi:aspartate-semialdehyde dehydrogenase [Ekhidna sp.]|uniref:aspartate-semialdehyde dehydrogenase n=1 Tax=Ekhidna sp. TaxID=2608089 RepID=UPI003B515297